MMPGAGLGEPTHLGREVQGGLTQQHAARPGGGPSERGDPSAAARSRGALKEKERGASSLRCLSDPTNFTVSAAPRSSSWQVGTPLCIPNNSHLDIGIVTSIQANQRDVTKVKKGTECAIKITNASNPTMTFGRQFDATHNLFSKLSRESIDALKSYFKDEMTNADWKLVVKMKPIFGIL